MRFLRIAIGLALIAAACGDGNSVPLDSSDEQLHTEASSDLADVADALPTEAPLEKSSGPSPVDSDVGIALDPEIEMSKEDQGTVESVEGSPIQLGVAAILRRIGETGDKGELADIGDVANPANGAPGPVPDPDLPAVALNDGWPYQPKYPNTEKIVPPPRD